MKPNLFNTTLLALSVGFARIATASATNAVNSRDSGSKLRGSKYDELSRPTSQYRRALPGLPHPHSHSHHHSSYIGCLAYTNEELADAWGYYGAAPECSYTIPDDGSSDNADQSYGDDLTEVHEYTSEDGDGNGNGNGDGEDNGNGQDNNGGDDNDSYEVVVTNEDVLNGTDSDVYENFNVTQCGTYKNLWVWDLALSCTDKHSLDSCNCSFAEELLSAGLLECDDGSQCPDDCPVCQTCLTLIGCNVTDVPAFRVGEQGLTTDKILYIVAAVLAFLISSMIWYRSRLNKKGISEDLKTGLMAGEALYAKGGDGIDGLNSQSPTWEPPSVGSAESMESPTSAAAGAAVGAAAFAVLAAKQKRTGDDESCVTSPTVDETTVHDGNTLASSTHPVLSETPKEEDEDASADGTFEGDASGTGNETAVPESPRPKLPFVGDFQGDSDDEIMNPRDEDDVEAAPESPRPKLPFVNHFDDDDDDEEIMDLRVDDDAEANILADTGVADITENSESS